MIVRMWEVRTYAVPELVAWVCDTALPAVESDPRHVATEVFSATERVVVISRWHGEPVPFPEPPSDLVARRPHAWDFTLVDR